MEQGAHDLDSADASPLAEVTDREHRSAVETTNGILWYPVGVLLAVLIAATAFVFCFSGRWIR